MIFLKKNLADKFENSHFNCLGENIEKCKVFSVSTNKNVNKVNKKNTCKNWSYYQIQDEIYW